MNPFNELFIFEMANNHQGDIDHGITIIKQISKVVKKYKINGAIKLQYRNLEKFIHPDHQKSSNNKHVDRFLSTKLSYDDFKVFIDAIKAEGLKAIVTPFDEVSVKYCVKHDVDFIKIASCSADDWSLLNEVAKTNKKVIASTGGLELPEIDNLVSFLTNRIKEVAIMHCVAIYPTPNDKFNLHFISKMIARYKNVAAIGYSGHEAPDNYDVIKLALAKGATLFERHVGVNNKEKGYALNAYSQTPEQVDELLAEYTKAKLILGTSDKSPTKAEKDSILSLKRGVFIKEGLKKDVAITENEIFIAMPCSENQVTVADFFKVRARYTSSKNYVKNEALFEPLNEDTYYKVRQIIHKAKGILNELNIPLADKYEAELSHHYGIGKFDKFGAIIITMVNREYCKKLIIVFPGQHHPEQKHIKKEETFHILDGEINLSLNGISRICKKGDVLTVDRGVLHSFYSETGAVIEEISSTHFKNDSYYTDPLIAEQDPMQRKTVIEKL